MVGSDPTRCPIYIKEIETPGRAAGSHAPCSTTARGCVVRLHFEAQQILTRARISASALIRSDDVACCNYQYRDGRVPDRHGVRQRGHRAAHAADSSWSPSSTPSRSWCGTRSSNASTVPRSARISTCAIPCLSTRVRCVPRVGGMVLAILSQFPASTCDISGRSRGCMLLSRSAPGIAPLCSTGLK